jgi:hypothetical protein
MANRHLKHYETVIPLNGGEIKVKTERIKWDGVTKGKPKDKPGTFMGIYFYCNEKLVTYKGGIEITKEPPGYAKLRHDHIVTTIRKGIKSGNLESIISVAIKI